MKVNVKSSYQVKPSEPTWNGILALSEFDQTGTMLHVGTIYFYISSESLMASSDALIETLKASLSRTLVHFYPLAGRLSWTSGSRLVLNCNSNGVPLIEAESDAALGDLGDFSPSPEFDDLIPSVDYTSPIQEMPLFLGQLTKFKCGGISLGFAISHVVADGHGVGNFLFEWTRLSCGKPLSSIPFLDRKLLRAGDPPRGAPVFDHIQYDPSPLIVGQSSDESERKKETKVCILRLSKRQIDALKTAANGGKIGENMHGYTRYEAITAHIWRCASKARNHKPEQPTGLCIAVDFRKRMDPPLPNSYFGNAIIDVVATGVSGDIISGPLEYVACRIHQAIDSVTPEYLNSAIDFLKDQEDLIRFQEIHEVRRQEPPFYGNPNLCVISWMYLPLQGLDFGWGEEIQMARGTQLCDGDVVIRSDHEGDGSLLIDICLQVDHIEDFKKTFYKDINN